MHRLVITRHVRFFQSSGGDTPTRNLTEDAPLVDTPDHLYRHRSRPHCTTPPTQPATATATDTSTATATATPVRHHSHHPPPWPPQLPMSLPPPPLKTPPPPRTRRAGSPAVAFTKLAPHQKEIIRRPPTAAARRGRLWSPNSKDRIRLWFHLSTRPGTSLHSVPLLGPYSTRLTPAAGAAAVPPTPPTPPPADDTTAADRPSRSGSSPMVDGMGSTATVAAAARRAARRWP